jgi:hypothetical protein
MIVCVCVCVCVCTAFQHLNHSTDPHLIWYERYATEGNHNLQPFNFIQSVIIQHVTWRTHELVKGECHWRHLM